MEYCARVFNFVWWIRPFAIALLCVHTHAEKGLIDYIMSWHFIVSPGFFPSGIPHDVYDRAPAAESSVKAIVSHWHIIVVVLHVKAISIMLIFVMANLVVNCHYSAGTNDLLLILLHYWLLVQPCIPCSDWKLLPKIDKINAIKLQVLWIFWY